MCLWLDAVTTSPAYRPCLCAARRQKRTPPDAEWLVRRAGIAPSTRGGECRRADDAQLPALLADLHRAGPGALRGGPRAARFPPVADRPSLGERAGAPGAGQGRPVLGDGGSHAHLEDMRQGGRDQKREGPGPAAHRGTVAPSRGRGTPAAVAVVPSRATHVNDARAAASLTPCFPGCYPCAIAPAVFSLHVRAALPRGVVMTLAVRKLVGFFAAACALAVAAPAAAQDEPDRIQEGNGAAWTPTSTGLRWIRRGSCHQRRRHLGANDISCGMVIDYGYGFMPQNEGHSTDLMLKHAFQGHVQFTTASPHPLGRQRRAGGLNGGDVARTSAHRATTTTTTSTGRASATWRCTPAAHPAPDATIRSASPSSTAGVGRRHRRLRVGARLLVLARWCWSGVRGATCMLRLGLNGGFRGHPRQRAVRPRRRRQPADGEGSVESATCSPPAFGVGLRV